MLFAGEIYRELGPDYYNRRDPRREAAQLTQLGFEVTLTPVA